MLLLTGISIELNSHPFTVRFILFILGWVMFAVMFEAFEPNGWDTDEPPAPREIIGVETDGVAFTVQLPNS